MRVLITGATGLLGTALVAEFRNAGIPVSYLTTSKKKIVQEENYRGYYWHPDNGQIDTACFDGVTTIIHLAGASISERWTAAYKKVIIESRVTTARLLFDHLQKIEHQVTHYITASAIGAYPSSQEEIYYEDFPTYNPGFLGEIVKFWESSADLFSTIGIEVAKIRVGIVLAKQGGALEKLIQPIKYYAGAPLGSGKQWQSWIHIKDLAGIFEFVMVNGLKGIFNAVAPYPVTNKVLTQEVAKNIHKPLILPNVPAFILNLILGEMATIVLESQHVSADKIKELGYQFRFENLTEALEDVLKEKA